MEIYFYGFIPDFDPNKREKYKMLILLIEQQKEL